MVATFCHAIFSTQKYLEVYVNLLSPLVSPYLGERLNCHEFSHCSEGMSLREDGQTTRFTKRLDVFVFAHLTNVRDSPLQLLNNSLTMLPISRFSHDMHPKRTSCLRRIKYSILRDLGIFDS
jgi:hypothetical protein